MFFRNLKKEVESLALEVARLKKKTIFRFCPECETVQPMYKFLNYTTSFYNPKNDYKEHCANCDDVVGKRERAVLEAEANPEAVLACIAKKKKGKKK